MVDSYSIPSYQVNLDRSLFPEKNVSWRRAQNNLGSYNQDRWVAFWVEMDSNGRICPGTYPSHFFFSWCFWYFITSGCVRDIRFPFLFPPSQVGTWLRYTTSVLILCTCLVCNPFPVGFSLVLFQIILQILQVTIENH